MSEGGEPSSADRVPRAIWAIGFVSLLMDVSSEMIHALLPVYLVSVLGASALSVGFIEGVAEGTASVTKVFSGALSDRLGRRKLLALVGYALAAATKPFFALAEGVGAIVGARFVDRVGKGIRGAPRDSLVADIAPSHLRAASFGLRQSLDTLGALLGPIVALAVMAITADSFRTVFWIATFPAILSVLVLVVAVKEPEVGRRSGARPPRLAFAPALGSAYWGAVAFAAVLTLARFSEAFLILRAQSVGLAIGLVPVVLVVMNMAYALSAYPAGVLADRFGRGGILRIGIVLLIIADLVLALASTVAVVLAGVVLWGLHMGFTQGLFATLVADASPPEQRGRAFGVLNLVTGLAILAASVMAGALWDAFGARTTFTAGALLTTVALAGLSARAFAMRG